MTAVNVEDFTRFAAKLKTVDRKLRPAIRRRIRTVAGPISRQVVQDGAKGLPGGLAAHVAKKGARPLISQRATGVRVIFGKKAGPQIGQMNEGHLRHPTFGTPPWVKQSIPAGTFTAALEKELPRLRQAVIVEVRAIVEEF